MTELSEISRKHVTSIPAALKALATMERELAASATYERLRKIVDGATALKHLFADVDAVKAEAEDVILIAGARIGEEIDKVPKAKPPGKKILTAQGKYLGRAATGIPGSTRSRYKKLAAHKGNLKQVAKELRAAGKDATPSAVVRQITQGNKKQRRRQRERDLGQTQQAMPDKRYGVIYADPPWRFQSYSDDTGMDRAADNHYPTMTIEAIAALRVPAADDAVLFLWATVPMLRQALDVMEQAWGFQYKSHFVWIKDKAGHGFWNFNKHELLLIGTRGSIPAPAPGDQFESAIPAPRGKHSAKPFAFREMIEEMFPTLPKIELFAREKFTGWDAWGNEISEAAE
jgi:N6-adenosine-specific RNA methylase IME4